MENMELPQNNNPINPELDAQAKALAQETATEAGVLGGATPELVKEQEKQKEIAADPEKREQQPDVPQLMEQSGVSADYLNEIMNVTSQLEDLTTRSFNVDDIEDMLDLKIIMENINKKLGPQRMKKYTERFSETKYQNVVNEKNKGIVSMLDTLLESLFAKLGDTVVVEDAVNKKGDFEQALAICKNIVSLVRTGKQKQEQTQKTETVHEATVIQMEPQSEKQEEVPLKMAA